MQTSTASALQSDKDLNEFLQAQCRAAITAGGNYSITQTYDANKDYGVKTNYTINWPDKKD